MPRKLEIVKGYTGVYKTHADDYMINVSLGKKNLRISDYATAEKAAAAVNYAANVYNDLTGNMDLYKRKISNNVNVDELLTEQEKIDIASKVKKIFNKKKIFSKKVNASILDDKAIFGPIEISSKTYHRLEKNLMQEVMEKYGPFDPSQDFTVPAATSKEKRTSSDSTDEDNSGESSPSSQLKNKRPKR